MPIKPEFLIALGGNMPSTAGSTRQTIAAGLSALSEKGITLIRVSRMFGTPCFPAGAGPDYVNAAAVVQADMSAAKVMEKLHEIEAEMGRQRVQRWGQRTLDMDLLAMGDAIVPDIETYGKWHDLPPEQQVKTAPEQLILPHPRLHERAFVLIPLMDVAPDWVHPVLGRRVRDICADLAESDRAAVISLN